MLEREMNLRIEVRYNYRRKKEGIIRPERMKYRRNENRVIRELCNTGRKCQSR
jgi:hypothetical protein